MGRQGGRNKQLLGDLQEMTGYWKLEETALGCTLLTIGFGIGYGLFCKTDDLENDTSTWSTEQCDFDNPPSPDWSTLKHTILYRQVLD